ncbi:MULTISPECIES: methylated-DNA--[protein]-cysteine S-methyltransferase [Moraxella]|uniref:methylated-DNA--[protein]-cysteine S-methyltransferase n=1 Tax=Moraxella TaxID=475 RepID=UPI00359E2B25
MISTHYTPPHQLPTISLTIKDGRLVLLDWYDGKTQCLLAKVGESSLWVGHNFLDAFDLDQAVALMTINQLDEYFAGRRTVFDIPLDLSYGTAFEQSVWQALQAVEYGTTISYATLAQNINKPTAYRACANANGKNPISIVVPCHRVIASDGGIGGYTGGVHIKRTLLDLECRTMAQHKGAMSGY